MASEGRAATPAQASTASSPPVFMAATASANTPPSPSSVQLLSLPRHERSRWHRLLAAVDRASSRISSAHLVCRIGADVHEAPSRLRVGPFFRSLLPLAISRPRRPHRPHRRVSSRAPRLSPRAGGCMAADAGATAGAAADAAAARLEQPSPLPLQRRSFEPPRAAHPVRVRVAACLRATTPSTTSSSF